MSLATPSQSVSHKRFHHCVNFGSFSFFQASIWLRVNKVLQKLTKSFNNELKHLFQCCILIPRKCPPKTPFQHTVPSSPDFQTFLRPCRWVVEEPSQFRQTEYPFPERKCILALSRQKIVPDRIRPSRRLVMISICFYRNKQTFYIHYLIAWSQNWKL